MLVNLCFHISLTCGVFVGGINQTRYASVCQAVSRGCTTPSRLQTLNSQQSKKKMSETPWMLSRKKTLESRPVAMFALLMKLWKPSRKHSQWLSRWFPWLEAVQRCAALSCCMTYLFLIAQAPECESLSRGLFVYLFTQPPLAAPQKLYSQSNSRRVFACHICNAGAIDAVFQVGILLHYSTLATALWVGVTARNIYKQVTRKAKRYEELDEPPPPPRPMLR